jgi:hypothetical protein
MSDAACALGLCGSEAAPCATASCRALLSQEVLAVLLKQDMSPPGSWQELLMMIMMGFIQVVSEYLIATSLPLGLANEWTASCLSRPY